MRIASISISRFRSIIDAESIDLGNLTVLIGKNNEGKSNIIKALTVALESIEYYGLSGQGTGLVRPRNYNWDKDFPVQLRSDSQKNKKSRFRLDFSLTDPELVDFRETVKSSLNGLLPIEVQIGADNKAEFRVLKPGKGAASFAKKSRQVAAFVADRISIDHIPAVRTESDAISVIRSLIRRPLQAIEREPDYKAAVEKIRDLQKPVLDEVAKDVAIGLKKYIPAVKAVQIDTTIGRLYRGLTTDIDLIIDDGAQTSIDFKGDGIKSLVALSLAQRGGDSDAKTHVVAIEEPESHLHPGAVHELRQVVSELSSEGQVIISTHNPIFVDRNRLATTVLVEGGKARKAKNIESIRSALGVRVADNLLAAEYCVVVEGVSDAVMLSKLFSELSPVLSRLISRNWMIFDPLNGASKLDYKLSLIRNAMSAFHVIVDNDSDGQDAIDKAINKAQLSQSEYHLLAVRGTEPAELEDCVNQAAVSDELVKMFAGDWRRLPGKGKWSERMSEALRAGGKRWSGETERAVKKIYADAVLRDGAAALTANGRSFLRRVVQDIEAEVAHLEQV